MLPLDLLEVLLLFTAQYEVIEIFVLSRFLEGKDASHDDEEYDASGEDVSLTAIVELAELDLGRHVRHGAAVRLQGFDALVGGEAEISEFDVHVLVEQYVFDLDVAVDNILVVHVVHDSNELAAEKTAGVFAHATQVLAKIEHETSAHILHRDVYDV